MKQNILIIDQSHRTTELLNLIVTMYTNYNPIIETNKSSIVKLLEDTNFEFIIIDHIIKQSDDIISLILDKNPKQKIILLSDNIKCPLQCDNCFELFSFVRLLKPVKPMIILNYLNDNEEFSCPNKNLFNSINNLEKLYEFLNLDDEIFYNIKELSKEKIFIKSSTKNINIYEISKIENQVNDNYFTIKLNENSEIEISLK